MVDTGSEGNLMSEETFRRLQGGNTSMLSERIMLAGIGQNKVLTVRKVCVNIEIDDKVYRDVTFHVVPDKMMPYDVILGDEFLKCCTVMFTRGSVHILPEKEDDLRCVEKDQPNETKVESKDILGVQLSPKQQLKKTDKEVIVEIKLKKVISSIIPRRDNDECCKTKEVNTEKKQVVLETLKRETVDRVPGERCVGKIKKIPKKDFSMKNLDKGTEFCRQRKWAGGQKRQRQNRGYAMKEKMYSFQYDGDVS